MTLGQTIASCYSKYATFSGRAQRSEFWLFVLFHFLISLACMMLIPLGASSALLGLVLVGNFLPYVSVMVRRLHDTDHSGWWYWFAFVPVIGVVMLIIWFCTRGAAGENRFGSDPMRSQELIPPRG